jgi:putative endonuclease
MSKIDGVFNIKKNSKKISPEIPKCKSLNSKKGKNAELKAALYLVQKGYEILAVNYSVYNGEIDIICKDKNMLVFVEVKYKSTKKFGMGFEEVNINKQKKIINCAKLYMRENKIGQGALARFDIISVDDGKILHIENAFSDVQFL